MEGSIRSKAMPLSKLPLKAAILPYLQYKKPHVAVNTWISEKERLNQVQKLIGETTVRKITSDIIKQYVARRVQAGRSGKTVNLEVGALQRLMKEAGVWRRIGDTVKPLPQRSDFGRALEKDENIRVLEVAAKSKHWVWAKLVAILALNTTMRSCEIRGLQWKHLDFFDKTVTIRRQTTKSDAGERKLPLNADALAAILELRQLSKLLFGDDLQSEWYVFPGCEGFANPDPTRPMRGWRTRMAEPDQRRGMPKVWTTPATSRFLPEPGMQSGYGWPQEFFGRAAIPRFAPHQHNHAGRVPSVGFYSHGHCGSRLPQDVGTLQPHSDGRKKDRARRSMCCIERESNCHSRAVTSQDHVTS
jgi:integrase